MEGNRFFMKPTQELEREHQVIQLALKILDKMIHNLETGDEVSPEDFERVMEFFKIFTDKCHHIKEEDIFYPVMAEVEVMGLGGENLVAMMLTEHDLGREYVKKMSEGVERYKQGDNDASFMIMETARDYISLLSQHIDKEDKILYPIVDAHITEEQEHEFVKRFADLEQNMIGQGKHEELHKVLERLARVYLK